MATLSSLVNPVIPPSGLQPISKYEITSAVAALEFTLPTADFTAFELRFDGFTLDTSTNTYARFSSDGGSTFVSSAASYTWSQALNRSANTTISGIGTGTDTKMDLTYFDGDGPWWGCAKIHGSGAGSYTHLTCELIGGVAQATPGSGVAQVFTVAARTATELTNAIQIYPASGNITAGTVHVYGLAEGA